MSNLEMKIEALMRLAVAEDAAERKQAKEGIRTLMGRSEQPPLVKTDLESEARRVLLEMGVPDGIMGHRYLVKALSIVAEGPEIMDSVTKSLYPKIAKECNTTASRAERAIRHAVEVAVVRMDYDTLMRYFGNTIPPNKSKPTNSEFIARLANVIRERV